MNRYGLALWGLIGLAPLLGGCPRCPGPRLSLQALVAEHNANAAGVPKLWARARVRATFSDAKGRRLSWGSVSALAAPNALVMLAKRDEGASGPPDFVLIGRDVVELFRVGFSRLEDVYYMWGRLGDRGAAWLGRRALAGAPGATAVPIDALQLLEILGVTAMPEVRPDAMPAVVMTMETDPCAYVVRYLNPQPVSGHLKIWREVWFRWDARQPARPFRVRLFDADGLCRAVAEVGRYRPIEVGDDHAGPAPVMPTDIRVTWPAIKNVQTASAVHLVLSEMSTTHRFSKKVFLFAPPAGTPVTVVDSACKPDPRKDAPRP